MEPVRVMVIDSVHSSAEGRMHAGQIRRMKIVRPEAHALKSTRPSTGLEGKKSSTPPVNLESRPSLVIRRRIMVPHLDAATESPALSNSSTTTGSQDKKPTDLTRSHLDVILSRSSSQDQTCKMSTTTGPQPPKTIHLFDLNEMPGLADCASVAESPTSTIASAHSTAHDGASTRVPEVKLLSGVEGDGVKGDGAKLAVDLGLLPKTHHGEGDISMELGAADLETPPRKRLRKLSEYQPTHDSLVAATVHVGNVCVRKLPEIEVKKAVVVDDEVLGAASVLMTLSSKKRSVDSIADGESSGFFGDEDGAGPSSAAASATTSSRSLGSGGSVLLRPSNKQRYRSMGELMAQAPGLKRGY